MPAYFAAAAFAFLFLSILWFSAVSTVLGCNDLCGQTFYRWDFSFSLSTDYNCNTLNDICVRIFFLNLFLVYWIWWDSSVEQQQMYSRKNESPILILRANNSQFHHSSSSEDIKSTIWSHISIGTMALDSSRLWRRLVDGDSSLGSDLITTRGKMADVEPTSFPSSDLMSASMWGADTCARYTSLDVSWNPHWGCGHLRISSSVADCALASVSIRIVRQAALPTLRLVPWTRDGLCNFMME